MNKESMKTMKVKMSLVNEKGEQIAETEINHADLEAFRKRNGTNPSMVLANMLSQLENAAFAQTEEAKKLAPRKPGGVDFNR